MRQHYHSPAERRFMAWTVLVCIGIAAACVVFAGLRPPFPGDKGGARDEVPSSVISPAPADSGMEGSSASETPKGTVAGQGSSPCISMSSVDGSPGARWANPWNAPGVETIGSPLAENKDAGMHSKDATVSRHGVVQAAPGGGRKCAQPRGAASCLVKP